MVQVVEMTDQEKLEMYMKLSKEELAKMLIESNKQIGPPTVVFPTNTGTGHWPNYPWDGPWVSFSSPGVGTDNISTNWSFASNANG